MVFFFFFWFFLVFFLDCPRSALRRGSCKLGTSVRERGAAGRLPRHLRAQVSLGLLPGKSRLAQRPAPLPLLLLLFLLPPGPPVLLPHPRILGTPSGCRSAGSALAGCLAGGSPDLRGAPHRSPRWFCSPPPPPTGTPSLLSPPHPFLFAPCRGSEKSLLPRMGVGGCLALPWRCLVVLCLRLLFLVPAGVPVRSGDATFPKAMDNVTVRQGESATLR